MMILKIETSFVDKYNGKRYNMGDEIEFEADRAKELLADNRHLVSEVETIRKPVKVDEAPKKARRKKN